MSNKTIGQFFSGSLVSDLLVCSAGIREIETITAIDPMVGKADMLDALQRAGAQPERLFGIDIDGEAIAGAETAVPRHNLLTADAFSDEATALYRTHEWDLVITNPPYVRYQKLQAMYGDDPVDTVRTLLGSVLYALDDNGAKELYLNAARSYSGLADLAVPCWILCAYLVRPGGKLAMVLPDSWLKREYATPIHKILYEDFSVDRIIVDESRSWFVDAQVKTSLLVAIKNKRRDAQMQQKAVRYVGLTKHVASSISLVGNLEYGDKHGTDAFESLCTCDSQFSDDRVWVRNEALFLQDGPRSIAHGGCSYTATLRDWGINVGQGLRTGANGFFYFTKDGSCHASNSIWESLVGNEPVELSKLPLIAALRYQDEIGSAYLIDAHNPSHFILQVTKPIEQRDGEADSMEEASLARYISYCETHDVVQNGRKQRIPHLSAVRTNGPTSDARGFDRYWYMLPVLKDRHRPDLVIPRINGGVVRAYLLPEGHNIVVDANFSTLWIDTRSRDDAYTALALLNSSYVRLELEATCNVLGGGALKCEAVSIRKIALPVPSMKLRQRLRDLGIELAQSEGLGAANKTQYGIDIAIADEMSATESASEIVEKWRRELDLRVKIRRE